MADTKISNLPSGSPVQTTDNLLIQRGNANYRVTVGDVALNSGEALTSTDGTVAITPDNTTGKTNLSVSGTFDSKYDKTGGPISGNVNVHRAEIGGMVQIIISNDDNTNPSSDAQQRVTTAGANSGSAYTTYTTYGVADWSSGFNNQSKKYEIAKADSLGDTVAFTIDASRNADLPAGTLTVVRDPTAATEVATKRYADLVGAKPIDAEYQIDLNADTYLTKVYSVIAITPQATGFKLFLPSMSVIRQTMTKGTSIRILNLDLDDNDFSFEVCYNDGTVLGQIDSNRGYEFILENPSTEGEGFFPIPYLFFLLSPERGPITGLMTLRPDDIENYPMGTLHLVPGGGNPGDVLQNSGNNQVPVWAPSNIPPAVVTPFTPNDQSNANLTFSNVKAQATVFGKVVLVTMYLEYPATANTNTAKIGNLPINFNSTADAQVGACLVLSPYVSDAACVFKGIPGTNTGYIVVAGFNAKNEVLNGAKISITLAYITD